MPVKRLMRFEDENEFNAAMRQVLRSRGMQCVHVRETDTPGPLDLIVWKGRKLGCWIELKVDDQEVRPSQKEFIRNNYDSCMVMRWRNEENHIQVWFTATPLDAIPYKMTWEEFINDWSYKLAAWLSSDDDE